MKKEELAQFIKGSISYDAGGGEDCPYCHKNIKSHNYWIDHKSSLASNIASQFGVETSWDKGFGRIIMDVLNEFQATGNKNKDAMELAERILQAL